MNFERHQNAREPGISRFNLILRIARYGVEPAVDEDSDETASE